MKCSNCSFNNPGGMKFCGECGSALPLPEPEAVACATCGFGNRPSSRYCGECGTRLPALTGPIRSFAAQYNVVEEPPTPRFSSDTPRRSEDERKIVTIIFGDIAGFTAMAEQLDPEEVKLISDKCLDLLTKEVHRYDGKVDKYMGDNIMVLFGAPTSHEDDPERAVRCSLEMQRSIKSLSEELKHKRGFTLDLHIGINTGEVMAGIMGGNREQDYTVMGDAVNLAARLQHAANVGHILVGETTARATLDIIEYRELPPMSVRGKAQPVPVWDVIGVKARRNEKRQISGLEAPMQGRDTLFSTIKLVYHAVERERKANLALVYGAAGVGKSRFLYEFEKYLDGLPEQVYYLKGRCLPYGSGNTYAAFGEMIKKDCGILDDDSGVEANRKLNEQVTRLYREVGDQDEKATLQEIAAVSDRLGFLLSLEEAENPLNRIGGDNRRDEIFWGLRRYFERKAALAPLVLAVEDIHWARPSLLDFLDHLLTTAQGVPILVVAIARPELVEGHGEVQEAQARRVWAERVQNSYPTLVLTPLDEADSAAVLTELSQSAGLPTLPDHLHDHILAAAEGNPLYIEETVRMLVDSGIGGGRSVNLADVRVPDTIQALIGARIDGLEAGAKRTLQAAAVVGRIFWRGAVEHLYQPDAGTTTEATLRSLQEREFIVERLGGSRFAGEREFSFRSTLARDVAYNSLPKARRFKEHEVMAGWIAATAKGRVAEFSDLIGYHYEQAARLEREVLSLAAGASGNSDTAKHAITYLRTAGDRERSRQNISTAADLYNRALDLIRLSGVPLAQEYIELLCSHATMLEVQARYAQALTELGEAATLAAQQNDHSNRACALTQMAGVYTRQTRLEQARELAEEALALYQAAKDSKGEADVLAVLGEIALASDQTAKAQTYFRKLYTTCSALEDLSGQARALFQLGKICSQRDEFKEAIWFLQEAQALYTGLGDKRGSAYCLAELATTYAIIGQLQRAEGYDEQARDLMRTLGDRLGEAQVLTSLGHVYLWQGRLDEAERVGQNSVRLSTELGSRRQQVAALTLLGSIHSVKGDFALAAASYQEALQASTRFGLEGMQAAIFYGLASTAVGQGAGVEALSFAEDGLARVGSDDHFLRATLLRVLGQAQANLAVKGAEANMRHALELLQERDYPYELAASYRVLADYLETQGRENEAKVLRLHADSAIAEAQMQDGSEAMTQVLRSGRQS